jgi:hypothetical protein
MFRKKKQQTRVEITFKHGRSDELPPKVIIEILPGQEFQANIGTDELWEGDTLVKEFDWVAGYSRIYEYFYR